MKTFDYNNKKYRRATAEEIADYGKLIEHVKSKIRNMFQQGIPLFYARDCVFQELGIKNLLEFPSKKGCKTIQAPWHIRGFDYGTEI